MLIPSGVVAAARSHAALVMVAKQFLGTAYKDAVAGHKQALIMAVSQAMHNEAKAGKSPNSGVLSALQARRRH
jgi:hypothetical protein